MKKSLKRRLIYLVVAGIAFLGCVLIVKRFNHEPFIRGFLGDVIFISLLYFLLKTVFDFHPLKLAVFILLLAYATEFLQLFRLTTVMGMGHNKMARIILGSVFDPFDLLAYTIGAIIAYMADTRLLRRLRPG